MNRAGIAATIAVLGVVGVGDARRTSTQIDPLRAAPGSLDVELAGCAQVNADGVCELPPDRTLRVWIASPHAATARVFADDLPVASQIVPLDGGARHRVVVPPGAKRISARLDDGGAAWAGASLDEPAPPATVEAARALKESGDAGAARAMLAGRVDAFGARERALALGVLARIDRAQGHFEKAADGFRASIAACRSARLASQAAADAFALAYTLGLLDRFDEALTVLAAAERDGLGSNEARARIAYHRAIADEQLGDYRAALAELRDAGERARRLGVDRLAVNVQTELAAALQTVGRPDEALASLRALELAAEEMNPCDRANVWISVGWITLLARDAPPRLFATGDVRAASPAEPLLRALALFPERCSDAYTHANVLTNLALVAAQDGDAAAARARVAEARRVLPKESPLLEPWWLEAEARASGDPARALFLFRDERRSAEETLSPDIAWRATVGIAESLEAMGDTRRALDEYRRAEALLDDVSLDVPLGEGRQTFLADRERSARSRVALLLAAGRAEDAMDAARQAGARVIRALERATLLEHRDTAAGHAWSRAVADYLRGRRELVAQAERDWALPADEHARVTAARVLAEAAIRAELDAALAAVARTGAAPHERAAALERDATRERSEAGRDRADAGPSSGARGTLTLLYHPTRGGWVGFADDGARVVARPLGPAPADETPARLSAWLLDPFDAELRAAKRVRLLPSALRAIDFHALPFAGEPLIARATVEYALDTRREPAARNDANRGAPRTALVVSDPRLDLAEARAEGDAVAHALGGVATVRSLSGEEVTHAATMGGIGAASLLHYAGHGVFAGRDGWESALALGGGERLTVSDILSLPHTPALVTLSSCLAARTGGDATVEGLGVAHAFVLAGAAAVVAPTRAVDDALAAAMSRAFYDRLATPDEGGARAALRAAQLAIRAERPSADWAAYRLLVP